MSLLLTGGNRQYITVTKMCTCDAAELQELQKKEKEMNVQPDWEIDAFTKAQIRTGKRHSIVTDLILKLLGLDVSLRNK